ncbi:hypothetical protein V8G54_015562 [Vigna mungo]|uniref:Uncharacterized protein n=1 Tax=Vigna mungo TaxID=3915 RepID=A0AAQ3NM86_VIGMU
MASNLQMSPEVEQIHGEIRDNFRALANGFQKLDKIKDANRQTNQLEELTEKMRESKRLVVGMVENLIIIVKCDSKSSTSYLSGRLSLPFFNVPFLKEVKFPVINGFRLIKEFDRKIKDEEGRNSPEVNKQLNDEKQSMVSTQNTYFQFFLAHVENTVSNSSKFWSFERRIYAITSMINRYMNTIGNKKLELFDNGAGASEPTADENVRLASGKMFDGIGNWCNEVVRAAALLGVHEPKRRLWLRVYGLDRVVLPLGCFFVKMCAVWDCNFCHGHFDLPFCDTQYDIVLPCKPRLSLPCSVDQLSMA